MDDITRMRDVVVREIDIPGSDTVDEPAAEPRPWFQLVASTSDNGVGCDTWVRGDQAISFENLPVQAHARSEHPTHGPVDHGFIRAAKHRIPLYPDTVWVRVNGSEQSIQGVDGRLAVLFGDRYIPSYEPRTSPAPRPPNGAVESTDGNPGGGTRTKKKRKPVIRTPPWAFDDIEIVERTLSSGRKIWAAVSQKHSKFIICGRTQSGKTYEVCETLVRRMDLEVCTAIYWCRNYKAEMDQQAESISERFLHRQQGIAPNKRVVKLTSQSAWEDLVHSIYNQDSDTVYIGMASKENIDKLFKLLPSEGTMKFISVVDEADQYIPASLTKQNSDDSDDSAVSKALKILNSASLFTAYTTATCLDLPAFIEDDEIVTAVPSQFAFRDEIEGVPRMYRSLHKLHRLDPLMDIHECPVELKDDPLWKPKNAAAHGRLIIKEAITNGWNLEYNRRDARRGGMPYMFLHFVSNTQAVNAEVARLISAEPVENISIPAITFDMNGARIYIDGVVQEDRFKDLRTALSHLRGLGLTTGPKTKFVYVLAGQMVSRAFTVTCKARKMYPGCTIYDWKGDRDVALLVQRLGRALGISSKEYVCAQRLYIPLGTYHKALDYTDHSTEMIKAAVENPEDECLEMLQKVTIGPSRSRSKLSKTGTERYFKTDPTRTSPHQPRSVSTGSTPSALQATIDIICAEHGEHEMLPYSECRGLLHQKLGNAWGYRDGNGRLKSHSGRNPIPGETYHSTQESGETYRVEVTSNQNRIYLKITLLS